MIIVLNGPLGVGKSSLAEALSESIQQCVMLDGDHVVAANPPPEGTEHLHSTIELLVAHHRSRGYVHFVINHLWTSPVELDDLSVRLSRFDDHVHIFLLTLPVEENIRRIEMRASVRAMDELEWERQTCAEERELLDAARSDLGEPFDVSQPLSALVSAMLRRLGMS